MSGEYGEHVVSDVRLARVEERFRLAWIRLPEDAQFLTYIQPRRETATGVLPPQAVFMVVSQNPRHPAFRLATTGTAALSDWEETDREYRHFVGREDPLATLFRPVVRAHVRTIQNLREMS